MIWNKVTYPRNRTMLPKAGGRGILLREGSTHRDWPFSSVLRGCGRRIRLFNNTVPWFDLRSPRRSLIEGLISSAVVLRGGPFGRRLNPEDLDLVTHPSVSNLLPTGHVQPRIAIKTFWITQLIRWFLSVTFVDDRVMLQYQKVDHVYCDGFTV